MGQKQDEVLELLSRTGRVSERRPRPSRSDIESAGLGEEVEAVFQNLSATGAAWPARPGAWDLVIDDVAVELDEQLHFNRYRDLTLNSPIYARLGSFPIEEYRSYCQDHEARCLAAGGYGGKWSNASSQKQFGVSNLPGDLTGGGAARWKQRAFYDFVKDLAPLAIGMPVARLSIWDTVVCDGRAITVGDLLSKPTTGAGSALQHLIDLRVVRADRP